jgi:8-oxo-dGTP pyrophosphatase MutT (NUDIX family)
MLTIHAAGDWRQDQVYARRFGEPRRIVPEIEKLIEQAWTELLEEPGIQLFDGPMVRLSSHVATPDRLDLVTADTSYKAFVGTNMAHPELATIYGPDVMANPIGVSPLVITADRYILMGRRQASLAYYPSRIHPFSGAMEPKDSHPFDTLHRELGEEISLLRNNIAEARVTGIAEDHALRQTELIFRVLVRHTRDQIIATVDRHEHHDTWFIPATAEAIEEALVGERQLTPVACAAMLLWGRLQFGGEWFTKQYEDLQEVHS